LFPRKQFSSRGASGTISGTAFRMRARRRSFQRPGPRRRTSSFSSCRPATTRTWKQRIAIARALIAHPRVLILDDSTSSVDVETETRIQTALEERQKGCTTLVVAQRISTVLEADHIVVIDEGRVAAEGTHQQLMASSGIYREIYESQLGDGPAGGAPDRNPGAAS
jgi:ABC-type antimicrobial peptide transport system ATPase subunit